MIIDITVPIPALQAGTKPTDTRGSMPFAADRMNGVFRIVDGRLRLREITLTGEKRRSVRAFVYGGLEPAPVDVVGRRRSDDDGPDEKYTICTVPADIIGLLFAEIRSQVDSLVAASAGGL